MGKGGQFCGNHATAVQFSKAKIEEFEDRPEKLRKNAVLDSCLRKTTRSQQDVMYVTSGIRTVDLYTKHKLLHEKMLGGEASNHLW
jgi:hypothetical protein